MREFAPLEAFLLDQFRSGRLIGPFPDQFVIDGQSIALGGLQEKLQSKFVRYQGIESVSF